MGGGSPNFTRRPSPDGRSSPDPTSEGSEGYGIDDVKDRIGSVTQLPRVDVGLTMLELFGFLSGEGWWW